MSTFHTMWQRYFSAYPLTLLAYSVPADGSVPDTSLFADASREPKPGTFPMLLVTYDELSENVQAKKLLADLSAQIAQQHVLSYEVVFLEKSSDLDLFDQLLVLLRAQYGSESRGANDSHVAFATRKTERFKIACFGLNPLPASIPPSSPHP